MNHVRNRKVAYINEKIGLEEMVVALWEKIIESRPEESIKLQKKRVLIKRRFPKEE